MMKLQKMVVEELLKVIPEHLFVITIDLTESSSRSIAEDEGSSVKKRMEGKQTEYDLAVQDERKGRAQQRTDTEIENVRKR
jgi:hypothetical protein